MDLVEVIVIKGNGAILGDVITTKDQSALRDDPDEYSHVMLAFIAYADTKIDAITASPVMDSFIPDVRDFRDEVLVKLDYTLRKLGFLRELVVLAGRQDRLDELPSLSELGLFAWHEKRERDDKRLKPLIKHRDKTIHVTNDDRLGAGGFGSVKTGWMTTAEDESLVPVAVKKVSIGYNRFTKAYELKRQYLGLIEHAAEVAFQEAFAELGLALPMFAAFGYSDGKWHKAFNGRRSALLTPKIAIVSQIASGNAFDLLQKTKDKKEILSILYGVANLLCRLHDLEYSHTDFKLQNILYIKKEDGYQFYLTDFLFTTPQFYKPYYPAYSRSRLCGTFFSPEVLACAADKKPVPLDLDLNKTDVFAFGIQLYSIIKSFLGKSELKTIDGYSPKLRQDPAYGSLALFRIQNNLKGFDTSHDPDAKALVDICLGCLEKEPSTRYSSFTLLLKLRSLVCVDDVAANSDDVDLLVDS